jgi:hypothetical protein
VVAWVGLFCLQRGGPFGACLAGAFVFVVLGLSCLLGRCFGSAGALVVACPCWVLPRLLRGGFLPSLFVRWVGACLSGLVLAWSLADASALARRVLRCLLGGCFRACLAGASLRAWLGFGLPCLQLGGRYDTRPAGALVLARMAVAFVLACRVLSCLQLGGRFGARSVGALGLACLAGAFAGDLRACWLGRCSGGLLAGVFVLAWRIFSRLVFRSTFMPARRGGLSFLACLGGLFLFATNLVGALVPFWRVLSSLLGGGSLARLDGALVLVWPWRVLWRLFS